MENKPKIFVLFGASGSGKSTILNFIKNIKDCQILPKDTTRPLRLNEKKENVPELNFIKTFAHSTDYTISYNYCGFKYGIRKDLIENLSKNKLYFVILSDIESIKEFKNKVPNSLNIYIHCDPDHIPERIIKRDGLILKKRQKKIVKSYKDFIKNNTLFDHVLINLWEWKFAKQQINNIIDLYR